MNRILAFAAWRGEFDAHGRGERRLDELSRRFGLSAQRVRCGSWRIVLVGRPGQTAPHEDASDIDFALGPDPVGQRAETAAVDRYLRVRCDGTRLEISSDYVGSIPLFYETSGRVVSNILPVVVALSGLGIEDVDPQDLVGLLTLSHPAWEETAFRSVRVAPPDVRTVLDPGAQPTFHRKNSIRIERRVVNESTAVSELAALNTKLVDDSLGTRDVVLPLSAGYDSRLILGVLAARRPPRGLRAFTYGPEGSIDVEAAKELARRTGVTWSRVELPCKFLGNSFLEDVGAIFGGHLHFHGMYQIEFIQEVRRFLGESEWIWTSGFMTGVPAGQHIGMFRRKGDVLDRMQAFSQSKVLPWWVLREEAPHLAEGCERLRRRLQCSYEWIEGEDDQRMVVADLMTRQRHFISYYPRIFEWMVDERSPHMNPAWANFFLALPPDLLQDRRCVERMFASEMPHIAGVVSNSNGLRSPMGHGRDPIHFASLLLTRLGLGGILPRRLRKNRMAFDQIASGNAGVRGFWPAVEGAPEWEWIESILPARMLGEFLQRARRGEPRAIDWMSRIQAVAYDIRSVLG